MLKYCLSFIFLFSILTSSAQELSIEDSQAKDSIRAKKKADLIHHIGQGYIPLKYFNLDLRYLVKFNQYEGIRTGLGGTTNDRLSEKFKINGYLVYGFRDSQYKYSLGTAFRLIEKDDMWVKASYTNDLQETASTHFLTDKRVFEFMEPRLLNISLFYQHITKAISLKSDLGPKLNSAVQFSSSYIDPKFNYKFVISEGAYTTYDITMGVASVYWNPFDIYKQTATGYEKKQTGYPKLMAQYSQSFKGPLEGDFNFYKFDFKGTYHFIHNTESHSEIDVASGIAIGDTPLTHLYHAYPNNINKATIMQRFSIAGLNSFETMYFNEFFSDTYAIIQFKHFFKPMYHSTFSKPQLVLLSRFAIGNMQNIQRHQEITFNTLEKGYYESGFEIDQLIFGFGLSFTYRYGPYHLPDLEDNIALKFTFNVTL